MGLGLLDFCLKTGTSKSRARIQDYTLETSGLDYYILKILRIRFMPSSRVFVFFFPLCWVFLMVHRCLIVVASLVVHGFQVNLAVVAQGLISSATCGIFLHQGSNPRLLLCQADS